MFASGELRSLIDLGLRGMTSNPTIFEKAIGSGTDYDEQLRELTRPARSECRVRGAGDRRHSQRLRRVPGAVRFKRRRRRFREPRSVAVARERYRCYDRRSEAIVANRRPAQPHGENPRHTGRRSRDYRGDRSRCERQRDVALLHRVVRGASQRLHRRHRAADRRRATGRGHRLGRERVRQPHRHRGRQTVGRSHREG